MRFRSFSRQVVAFLVLCSMTLTAAAQGVLAEYLKPNERVQAEVIVVVTPDELGPLRAKIDQAAVADPEWFAEHIKKDAGEKPFLYDERMGLTKEEYDTYLALWDSRKFEVVQKVHVELIEGRKGMWKLDVAGPGLPIRLLSYSPEDDHFVSPNGDLKRIEDIAASPSSILRKWSGKEWRVEKETPFGRTKTNFAIGRMAAGGFGLLVYRYQEVGAMPGERYDQSVLVRFKPVLPAK